MMCQPGSQYQEIRGLFNDVGGKQGQPGRQAGPRFLIHDAVAMLRDKLNRRR